MAGTFSGQYIVDCDFIRVKELTPDGGAMITGFIRGQKISLNQTNEKHLSTTPYSTSSLINRVSNEGVSSFYLSRKVFRNTSLDLKVSENKIVQTQVTKKFTYRTPGTICNPYDFTGLSCVWGVFVPRNWPKKRTYPRTVKTTIFEKLYNGDVLFEETEIIESKTTTTKCRFLKQ